MFYGSAINIIKVYFSAATFASFLFLVPELALLMRFVVCFYPQGKTFALLVSLHSQELLVICRFILCSRINGVTEDKKRPRGSSLVKAPKYFHTLNFKISRAWQQFWHSIYIRFISWIKKYEQVRSRNDANKVEGIGKKFAVGFIKQQWVSK